MTREFTLKYCHWRAIVLMLSIMIMVSMIATLGISFYGKGLLMITLFGAVYLQQSHQQLWAPNSLVLSSNKLWRCKFLNEKEKLYRLKQVERHWYGYYLAFTSSKDSMNVAIPYFQIALEQRSAFARAINESGDKIDAPEEEVLGN